MNTAAAALLEKKIFYYFLSAHKLGLQHHFPLALCVDIDKVMVINLKASVVSWKMCSCHSQLENILSLVFFLAFIVA
jgi:hypothetical protein